MSKKINSSFVVLSAPSSSESADSHHSESSDRSDSSALSDIDVTSSLSELSIVGSDDEEECSSVRQLSKPIARSANAKDFSPLNPESFYVKLIKSYKTVEDFAKDAANSIDEDLTKNNNVLQLIIDALRIDYDFIGKINANVPDERIFHEIKIQGQTLVHLKEVTIIFNNDTSYAKQLTSVFNAFLCAFTKAIIEKNAFKHCFEQIIHLLEGLAAASTDALQYGSFYISIKLSKYLTTASYKWTTNLTQCETATHNQLVNGFLNRLFNLLKSQDFIELPYCKLHLLCAADLRSCYKYGQEIFLTDEGIGLLANLIANCQYKVCAKAISTANCLFANETHERTMRLKTFQDLLLTITELCDESHHQISIQSINFLTRFLKNIRASTPDILWYMFKTIFTAEPSRRQAAGNYIGTYFSIANESSHKMIQQLFKCLDAISPFYNLCNKYALVAECLHGKSAVVSATNLALALLNPEIVFSQGHLEHATELLYQAVSIAFTGNADMATKAFPVTENSKRSIEEIIAKHFGPLLFKYFENLPVLASLIKCLSAMNFEDRLFGGTYNNVYFYFFEKLIEIYKSDISTEDSFKVRDMISLVLRNCTSPDSVFKDSFYAPIVDLLQQSLDKYSKLLNSENLPTNSNNVESKKLALLMVSHLAAHFNSEFGSKLKDFVFVFDYVMGPSDLVHVHLKSNVLILTAYFRLLIREEREATIFDKAENLVALKTATENTIDFLINSFDDHPFLRLPLFKLYTMLICEISKLNPHINRRKYLMDLELHLNTYRTHGEAFSNFIVETCFNQETLTPMNIQDDLLKSALFLLQNDMMSNEDVAKIYANFDFSIVVEAIVIQCLKELSDTCEDKYVTFIHDLLTSNDYSDDTQVKKFKDLAKKLALITKSKMCFRIVNNFCHVMTSEDVTSLGPIFKPFYLILSSADHKTMFDTHGTHLRAFQETLLLK